MVDLSALSIKFHNLIQVKLGVDWLLISKFLENADNLEALTNKVYGGIRNWMESRQIPTCLSSHLKTVRIRKFRVTHEYEMLGCLLMNAKVLKLTKELKVNL